MTPDRYRFHFPFRAGAPIGRQVRLAAVLALLAGSAAAGLAPGRAAANAVMLRAEAGDCKGALGALNAGLAKNHPEVALLAGSMYDNGVCVRRDWQRAVEFYVLAHNGGQKAALYRLASGYAAPENGPDIAAALWWASRDSTPLIFPCGASAKAAQDPDLFVEELRSWPQQHLAECNYAVGVMATLAGELRYPERPLSFNLRADIEIRFMLAVPRMDMKAAGTNEYQPLAWVDGNALAMGRLKSAEGGFAHELRRVSERAMKRYPQPARIHPDAETSVRFVFMIENMIENMIEKE